MTVIIAKNQTAGDLLLTQLSAPDSKIPASGQVQLTDWNAVHEVQNDAELNAYINGDQVLLNVGGVDLTKDESLAAATPVVVGTNVGNVPPVVDVGGGTPGLPAVDGSQLTGVSSDPTSDIATSETLTTTTSLGDVLVNAMSITPPAGTYLVWFTGDVGSTINGGAVWPSIYSGGAQAAGSERESRGYRTSDINPFCCAAKVTVNGAQAIEGRWRVGGGTGTMQDRSLMILKVA